MAELPAHMSGAPIGEMVSREVLESHQRDAVLDRITPVFAKRGYPGTTVDDLLATGKVGVGNFYSLFEGKEDSFLAAFERIVTRSREQIEAAAAQGDWAERTYRGLGELVGLILASPLEARLALVESQSAGPVALSRYNSLLDEAIAWLERGRSYSAEAKGLPPGFEQSAISGLAYYLQQCLLDGRSHSAEELAAEAAELVLGPMVGAAELRRMRSVAVA